MQSQVLNVVVLNKNDLTVFMNEDSLKCRISQSFCDRLSSLTEHFVLFINIFVIYLI